MAWQTDNEGYIWWQDEYGEWWTTKDPDDGVWTNSQGEQWYQEDEAGHDGQTRAARTAGAAAARPWRASY